MQGGEREASIVQNKKPRQQRGLFFISDERASDIVHGVGDDDLQRAADGVGGRRIIGSFERFNQPQNEPFIGNVAFAGHDTANRRSKDCGLFGQPVARSAEMLAEYGISQ